MPISLMLMDFQMPRMNGLNVVQAMRDHIKQLEKEHSINIKEPMIVFLTSFKTLGFQNHLKAMKVNHCYEKPLMIEQLQNILQEAVSFCQQ